jgi:fused signal recognition particle receptor
MAFFQKLKSGLGLSANKLGDGITKIFTHQKLDDETLEALEELLISADMGVKTAASLAAELSKQKFEKEGDSILIKKALAGCIAERLKPLMKPLTITHSPELILVVGVNGNGKTTTIGKLAAQFRSEGKKVMVAACDTFRAAAVEQLALWAERTGSGFVRGAENVDPASVAFQAVEKAKAEGVDVLLLDTAGRLQNKKGLMEELVKITRVVQPHQTLMVLDATTGQNAVSQVQVFQEMVQVTGLIVTKLDGSAKGGVVVALADQFKLPIHAIGVGEGVEDLQAFDANHFAESLLGIA